MLPQWSGFPYVNDANKFINLWGTPFFPVHMLASGLILRWEDIAYSPHIQKQSGNIFAKKFCNTIFKLMLMKTD